MSNKILAIDDLDVVPQTFNTVRRNTSQKFEKMTAFDLSFSVNVGDDKEVVTRIRLTDEQAEKLATLLSTRHQDNAV